MPPILLDPLAADAAMGDKAPVGLAPSGRIWSISSVAIISLVSVGISGGILAAPFSWERSLFLESLPLALRCLARFVCFGRLLVRLLLVALMKLEFAAFKKGVGSALRIFCEVGIALVGGRGDCVEDPKTDIWEGGIHGASK